MIWAEPKRSVMTGSDFCTYMKDTRADPVSVPGSGLTFSPDWNVYLREGNSCMNRGRSTNGPEQQPTAAGPIATLAENPHHSKLE